MIRVRTGSRLHFGLFSLPSEQNSTWTNSDGAPAMPRREFGGVGMMIDHPGIDLTVEHSDHWTAEGPLSERALQVARNYSSSAGISGCFRIRINCAAPEHVGLGTGTQLALAVGRAIAKLTNFDLYEESSARLIAKRVGRGRRSAIGIEGFAFGGLIVESGKTRDDQISPCVASAAVSEYWNVLLILPQGLQGAHGKTEIDAFAEISKKPPDDRATDALCRITLLGMLPAIHELDLAKFGEAVFEYNRRAGEMFKSIQHGIYAHPRIEEIVHAIRGFGIKGVGQSSWGPAVFAIAELEDIQRLQQFLVHNGKARPEEMIVTKPRNQGAILSAEH